MGDFEDHQAKEHSDKASKTRVALSARTVKQLLITLRTAFNVAVRWDMVQRNVAARVDPPKVMKPNWNVFTSEQA